MNGSRRWERRVERPASLVVTGRLPEMEAYALRCCMNGHPPLTMPRSLDWLADRDMIDCTGAPTTAGRTAWTAHTEALNDESLRNNVIPSIWPADLEALERARAGKELTPAMWVALERHQGLASFGRDGWTVNETGRRVLELCQREKTLTQET